MTFDLWPADSKFELDLYFSVIYLHIKNIQNPSNIFEVIVRKPIWIYNELWPLTFDLRTPNSNLTCILVSSTYISKISKIRPRFLKLLCGNQFGGRTDGRTGATHNAPSRLRLRGHKKNNTKHLGQQDDKRTTSMRWTQVIARMSYTERG